MSPLARARDVALYAVGPRGIKKKGDKGERKSSQSI